MTSSLSKPRSGKSFRLFVSSWKEKHTLYGTEQTAQEALREKEKVEGGLGNGFED